MALLQTCVYIHWCSAETDTALFFIYFSYGKNIIFLALLQFNFLYELNAISLKNFWQFYGHKRSQFVLIPLQKLSTPHWSRLRFLLVFRWYFPVFNRESTNSKVASRITSRLVIRLDLTVVLEFRKCALRED